MKSRALLFLWVSTLASFLGNVSAIPLRDSFDYPDGADLAGQTNVEGNVWAPTGTNTVGDGITVTNRNLTYPGLATSSGRAVIFGGLGLTDRVPVGPTTGANPYIVSSGTLYYSFIFTIQDFGTLTNSGGFLCGFNNLTGAQAAQPSVVGARLYSRLNTNGPTDHFDLGIGKQPGSVSAVAWSTNALPNGFLLGGTNFVVASYTFVNSATNNDVCSLWINPDPATFGAPLPPVADLVNSDGSDLQVSGANQIESFLFRQGNAQVPGIVIADELRIGTTWASVTPPANAPTPTPVPLNVVLASTNALVLSWPTNQTSFALQSSASLSNEPVWATISGPITVIGTEFLVTNTPTLVSKFYRLKAF